MLHIHIWLEILHYICFVISFIMLQSYPKIPGWTWFWAIYHLNWGQLPRQKTLEWMRRNYLSVYLPVTVRVFPIAERILILFPSTTEASFILLLYFGWGGGITAKVLRCGGRENYNDGFCLLPVYLKYSIQMCCLPYPKLHFHLLN